MFERSSSIPMMLGVAHRAISCDALRQPSYSKPILTSTRYSTISPSRTTAVDFTTSTVCMLRTVFDAVATACRAASLHDLGLVPTISRMMMTPTATPAVRHEASDPADQTPPAAHIMPLAGQFGWSGVYMLGTGRLRA